MYRSTLGLEVMKREKKAGLAKRIISVAVCTGVSDPNVLYGEPTFTQAALGIRRVDSRIFPTQHTKCQKSQQLPVAIIFVCIERILIELIMSDRKLKASIRINTFNRREPEPWILICGVARVLHVRSLLGCSSCIVKSFRSRRSFISSPH